MVTVTIHELDDQVFANISALARANQRAVDEEIKELLLRSVDQRTRREQLVKAADAIADTTVEVSGLTESSLDLLRRDRSR
jgi:plasmid stability protein